MKQNKLNESGHLLKIYIYDKSEDGDFSVGYTYLIGELEPIDFFYIKDTKKRFKITKAGDAAPKYLPHSLSYVSSRVGGNYFGFVEMSEKDFALFSKSTGFNAIPLIRNKKDRMKGWKFLSANSSTYYRGLETFYPRPSNNEKWSEWMDIEGEPYLSGESCGENTFHVYNKPSNTTWAGVGYSNPMVLVYVEGRKITNISDEKFRAKGIRTRAITARHFDIMFRLGMLNNSILSCIVFPQGIRINSSYLEFNASLSTIANMVISRSNMYSCRLSGVAANGLYLNKSVLSHCDFYKSNLFGFRSYETIFVDCNFDKVSFHGDSFLGTIPSAMFEKCLFVRCSFKKCEFPEMWGCTFFDCEFDKSFTANLAKTNSIILENNMLRCVTVNQDQTSFEKAQKIRTVEIYLDFSKNSLWDETSEARKKIKKLNEDSLNLESGLFLLGEFSFSTVDHRVRAKKISSLTKKLDNVTIIFEYF